MRFHHLFGPWAIIITSLIADTLKFMVILLLFEVGFTMLVMAVNQPYKPSMELTNDDEITEQLLKNELEISKYCANRTFHDIIVYNIVCKL